MLVELRLDQFVYKFHKVFSLDSSFVGLNFAANIFHNYTKMCKIQET